MDTILLKHYTTLLCLHAFTAVRDDVTSFILPDLASVFIEINQAIS